MSPLQSQFYTFRTAPVTEREKGTHFEELIVCRLCNEVTSKDQYANAWTYADWAAEQGVGRGSAGFGLVAQTQTGGVHAMRSKLYALDYQPSSRYPVESLIR